MNRAILASVAAALLGAACAAQSPGNLVPLLEAPPQRAYEIVARLQARSGTGVPVEYAYDELRWKASGVGADAVVKTSERPAWDAAPVPYDPPDRPLLANPYPGPLQSVEPGAFPPAGRDLRVRGRYYVVEGLAIRYAD